MPEIRTYDQMEIQLTRQTPWPDELVGLALHITMKQDLEEFISPLTKKKAKFLWYAEHQSVFEHVQYTFLIQNVSRSFLGQITRQRTASPTSGSQHYQNYSDYPVSISEELRDADSFKLAEISFKNSFSDYECAISMAVPKEEARQLLPMGAVVSYLWTIDALNLAKFLRQRLCNRNVLEMRIFASKIKGLVENHFPELFNFIGPQCVMDKCYQGKMQCEEGTYANPC